MAEGRPAESTPFAFSAIKQQFGWLKDRTMAFFGFHKPTDPSMDVTGPAADAFEDGARAARRTSSSSSDILVAPGPTAASTQKQDELSDPSSMYATTMPERHSVQLEVRDGRFLVFKFAGYRALQKRLAAESGRTMAADAVDRKPVHIKSEMNSDDHDGPNHRGTYSKAYTLQHPEIVWVHRGQGRYKPAETTTSSQSDVQAKGTDAPRRVVKTWKASDSHSPVIPQKRSRSWDVKDQAALDSDVKESKPSLRRHRTSDGQNLSPEHQSAARARRAKPNSANDSERRSSRFSAHQNYNEDSESADEDDMARNKEPTFNEEYVRAHPDEDFYHTGNGFWKRGTRPRRRTFAKNRDSEGHAVMRAADGTWTFDRNATIHGRLIGMYPGVEFHHCGNGWFKPGPDPTGLRTSIVAGDEDIDEEALAQEDEALMVEDESATVSKEYKDLHPEVDWVHRGNGRFKRKSAVSVASNMSNSMSTEPERRQSSQNKHVMGGSRRKSGTTGQSTEDDDGTLYSKAYVMAHGGSDHFHHRGQGRWARGPRPQRTRGNEEESDVDPDGLVDGDYVASHPHETFHHRGQGRWARGLPGPNASNKVAVRGPGAKEYLGGIRALDDDDEEARLPPLTALLVKAEGPEKFPDQEWFYRGGGKWARITKEGFEALQRGGNVRKPARGRARATNNDGPEAQLEREAAAAQAAEYDNEDDNGILTRPKMKRRRTIKYANFQGTDDVPPSKQSSKSISQAPTPRKRMLEPHEDILTEEDFPQLYRDNGTPEPEDFDEDGNPVPDVKGRPYAPLTSIDKLVKPLTKFDPSIRTTENLIALTTHTDRLLRQMQDEYLQLEQITAPHARIPRKPAKGGRVPADPQIFEDKKEADLYDYNYDPRRIGFQDPDAQKIQRDAEGRELRNRRNRSGLTASGTLPGWHFGDDEPIGSKRAVKPVHRFDGIVDPPRKRGGRNSAQATGATSKAPSMTPDRVTTPLGGPMPNGYSLATRGRLNGALALPANRRVAELRDQSVGGASVKRDGSPGASRKGRPPGSKNLHKRKDAGIKKGPRKPKTADGTETPGFSEAEGEA